jgi:hypothetical protein
MRTPSVATTVGSGAMPKISACSHGRPSSRPSTGQAISAKTKMPSPAAPATSRPGPSDKSQIHSNATTLILQKTPGAAAACGVLPVGAATLPITLLPGNGCSPDVTFWEAYMRTEWNPTPQLDIGLEILYSQRNTAFKGNAIVPTNGSRPPVFALDDQGVWTGMVRWQRNFFP